MKFVAEKLANDPVMAARFALEAQASAQIKSPHVVQVFDHGTTDDGVPYIVMELIGGVIGHVCPLPVTRSAFPVLVV